MLFCKPPDRFDYWIKHKIDRDDSARASSCFSYQADTAQSANGCGRPQGGRGIEPADIQTLFEDDATCKKSYSLRDCSQCAHGIARSFAERGRRDAEKRATCCNEAARVDPSRPASPLSFEPDQHAQEGAREKPEERVVKRERVYYKEKWR